MWLKADLHLHTCEGPEGIVRWSPRALIDLAAGAGYQILSITDHDTQTYDAALDRYARERGIVLIPGIEATVEGRHVLLYNFPKLRGTERTFREIQRHKGPNSLVIAPHPFFPGPKALGRRLIKHLGLFDAIEFSHFYTAWLNYNHPAVRLAESLHLPLVGNSDAHLPCQFGTTYSFIDAEPTPACVLSAIRAGQVRVVSRPLTTRELITVGMVLKGGTLFGPASWLVRRLEQVLGVTTPGAAEVAAAPTLVEGWKGHTAG